MKNDRARGLRRLVNIETKEAMGAVQCVPLLWSPIGALSRGTNSRDAKTVDGIRDIAQPSGQILREGGDDRPRGK